MTSRSNVERASALFKERDNLIEAAQLVLRGDDWRLSAAKKKDRYEGFNPSPFVSMAVVHLTSEFKSLIEAELRAQVEEIGRELRNLGISDDFSLDGTISDA